jgi:hypothetical protein
MKYNLFGLALAASSIVWLAALLSADRVLEKVDPPITRVILGKDAYSQLSPGPVTVSGAEMKRIADTEMMVIRVTGLVYLWCVPTLPLLVIRWARLRWRLIGAFSMSITLICAILFFPVN